MSSKTNRLWLAAALAAMSVFAMGCPGGEEEGTDVGCSADTDCNADENEICHPDAKQCVKTCESAAECDDSAKNCEAISDTNDTKICKCATDELCNDGNEGGSLFCSPTYEICLTKCSDDSGCPSGQTCNTDSGECSDDSAACDPECADGQVCNNGTCVDTGCELNGCAATEMCNVVTQACEAQATCDDSTQQPAACQYGQFCNSSDKCADVPTGTCANVEANAYTWNPYTATGNRGAVIYEVTPLPGDNNASGGSDFCPSGTNTHTVLLKAYTTGVFPATGTGLSAFFYVKVNGQELDAVANTLFRPSSGYTVSSDNKQLTLKVSVCSGDAQVVAGFRFSDGNEVCATLPD